MKSIKKYLFEKEYSILHSILYGLVIWFAAKGYWGLGLVSCVLCVIVVAIEYKEEPKP